MKTLLTNTKFILLLLFVIPFIGCEDDDTEILPEIAAAFTFTQNNNTGTVTFLNISDEAKNYDWDFGDGTSSKEINPIKTYTNGTYTVTLKASNVSGASASVTGDVTILIPEEIMLPITFDGANTNYEATTFSGTSFEVIDNPAPGGTNNQASKVGAVTNSGAAFEGLFFELGSPIDLTVLKSIKMDFWSENPIDVLVKLEADANTFVEITASHQGTGWEELVFTFDSVVSYSKFTMFVDGPGTTTGTFYFDDIMQIETPVAPFDAGLLSNGDFSDGNDPWTGGGRNIVTEGGNSFNSVNVETAGEPFDVNLSQAVEITQGTNYILTFDASSDRARTILAGIGLSVDPFTNTAPSVNLTTATQTFTLQLSAADFGGANSRVLFDMGAEEGTVVIDNVSLVEGGDGSDSGGGGNDDPVPPTVGATAPTQDAADVISIFSDTYTDVNSDGFNFYGNATFEEVDISGNAALRYTFVEGEGGNFQIIELGGANQIDAAGAGMTNFRFDAWFPNVLDGNSALLLKLVDIGAITSEASITINSSSSPAISQGSWLSFDIPFTELQSNGLAGTANIQQIVIDLLAAGQEVYLDNIYFYKSTGTVGSGGELTTNGDFETGDTTGWLFFDNSGVAEITNTENNGGSFSAKITSGPTNNPGIKQERFGVGTIQPNQLINVTLDSKVESLADGAIVNVLAFSESATEGVGAVLHNLGTVNVSPGAWNSNSFSFTTAVDVSGGVSLLIEVVCGGATSCQGVVFFDNVSVQIAP